MKCLKKKKKKTTKKTFSEQCPALSHATVMNSHKPFPLYSFLNQSTHSSRDQAEYQVIDVRQTDANHISIWTCTEMGRRSLGMECLYQVVPDDTNHRSLWPCTENGQSLEWVTSFKYLGSVINDKGSKPGILSRIAQTTAALTRLKPVRIGKSISLRSKIRLMRSLVTSIFLYACE